MSELVPIINQKNKIVDDAVTLFVGGEVYSGWKNVRITKSLNQMSDSFSLQIADRWRVDQEPFRIKKGQRAHIHIGKDSIFDGYIDVLDLSVQPQRRSISISGRSRTADPIDSSIIEAKDFSGLKISEIGRKLLEPFGVQLIMAGPEGKAFDSFVTRQGETVFEAIDRLARQRSLVMKATPNGNLMLTQKGSIRAATEIRSGPEGNFLGGGATYDDSERYGEYIVKGQSDGFSGTEDQATGAEGSAKDIDIRQSRKLLILSENAVDASAAEERAKYEADLRAARSIDLRARVPGWRQENGALWDVNQITNFDVPFLGYRGDALINQVSYVKDSSGTVTELNLIRPDAFEFKKEVSKDPGNSLGWDKI